MALWLIVLGFPLLFAMLFIFRLSGLEGRMEFALSSIYAITLLFPEPMTFLAVFLLFMLVAVSVSSTVGLIRLPRNRAWKQPGKAAFFFVLELNLLMVALTAYFANIFLFSFRNLTDNFALGLLVMIVGILPGEAAIILLMDTFFSRLWQSFLGYDPGIFRGKTYQNLRKALRDKGFRRNMSLTAIAGLITIPLVLLILVILIELGML